MNSRKQGDLGTGFAISYFLSHEYTVSIPISDSQSYDLVVEKNNICYRVQVKTCFKKNKNGRYWVELRTVSNTRGKKLNVRKISKLDFELLFILDGDGKIYLIQSEEVDGLNGINLFTRQQFLVYQNKLFEENGRLTGRGPEHGANVIAP